MMVSLLLQEAEEESENLMENFLSSGDGGIEQFLEEYQEKRKLAHMRRIKIDKMRELLARQGGGATPSRQAPPPPAGALPYPSPGYSNMPLPYPR